MRMIEGRRDGAFILSEAAGTRSRESVTLAQRTAFYEAGSVLAVTAGTATKVDVAGAGKGVLTLANPAVGAGAKAGDYRVVFIEPVANAGAFQVEDPDGVIIGTGSVGVAFAGPVNFTIADGATDFVAGDVAIINVVPTLYGHAVPGTRASAILIHGTNAAAGPVAVAVIARDAEVKRDELVFHADVDTPAEIAAEIADLASAGIRVR